MQVVASLIQLQDLAIQSGRASPLHVVAPVRHPRTIGLINYITMHSHNAASHSQTEIGAVKAVTDNQHQHASHASHNKHHRPIEHAGSQAQEHNAGNMGGVGRQGVVMDVDVLLPDELLSGLLTQVSVQPELLSVMNDLFDAEGMADKSYLTSPVKFNTVLPHLLVVLLQAAPMHAALNIIGIRLVCYDVLGVLLWPCMLCNARMYACCITCHDPCNMAGLVLCQF